MQSNMCVSLGKGLLRASSNTMDVASWVKMDSECLRCIWLLILKENSQYLIIDIVI